MKAIMNPGWLAGLLLIVSVITSCTGNKKPVRITAEDVYTRVADVDINGQWYIESIVFDDSTIIRPYENDASVHSYFEFTDSTYDIMTNCNVFHGTMTINGDSIKLGDGMMTEIACEDMTTEEALCKILPQIVTIDVRDDSTIRLNSITPSEYIFLRKAMMEIK